ncbi:hypothetical protein GCM10009714_27350 [Microlunatus capsulatus]
MAPTSTTTRPAAGAASGTDRTTSPSGATRPGSTTSVRVRGDVDPDGADERGAVVIGAPRFTGDYPRTVRQG